MYQLLHRFLPLSRSWWPKRLNFKNWTPYPQALPAHRFFAASRSPYASLQRSSPSPGPSPTGFLWAPTYFGFEKGKQEIQCRYCHLKGHTIRDCRKKEADEFLRSQQVSPTVAPTHDIIPAASLYETLSASGGSTSPSMLDLTVLSWWLSWRGDLLSTIFIKALLCSPLAYHSIKYN